MFQRLLPLLGLALLPQLVLPAAAEKASLVHDLNSAGPEGFERSLYASGLTSGLYPVGDKALFQANEPGSGVEFWATDGTTAGTEMIAEGCPGPCSSEAWLVGTAGGVTLFWTSMRGFDDGIQDYYRDLRLWRSDGTPEGTYPLGPSDRTGSSTCYQSLNAAFAFLQGALYFTVRDDAHGCELWRTDGTMAGTRKAVDVYPGPADSYPRHLFVLKGRLHFLAQDAGGAGLWSSDGTQGGTRLVQRLPGLPFEYETFVSTGSRVFFRTYGELWTSDGTAEGTRRLARGSSSLQVHDGILYFFAALGNQGQEIWRSDGTVQGTLPVTAFQNTSPFQNAEIGKLGNLLIFAASEGGSGLRLWTSGGTPQTTRLLAGCPGGCPQLTEQVRFTRSGSRLLFAATDSAHGNELWSTDGTGPGTRLVRDLCDGSCDSRPEALTPYLGALYFHASDSRGNGLWKTDGTTAGTSLVALLPVQPFHRYGMTVVGGKLFLPVDDQATTQLWVSDGTPEGTERLTLIGRGGPNSNPAHFVSFGDGVLFVACDGERRQLWRSGGTAATTIPLGGPPNNCSSIDHTIGLLRVIGNVGYFLEFLQQLNRYQLWRTDGTEAGTFPLPPEPADFQYLGLPVSFGGKLLFTIHLPDGSVSVWESDGTVAGTRKRFDLPGKNAFGLTVLGQELYFTAVVDSMENIWRSDGTAAGTRQVTGFSVSNPVGIDASQLASIGSTIYFRTVDGTARGANELWRTDGTGAGTFPLQEPGPPRELRPDELIAFQGALYFTAFPPGESRRAIWKTDGTVAGTGILKRVGPPVGPLNWEQPAAFTPVGAYLVFAADDGEHGVELWRTDGTPGGTVLVRDIVPGRASSYPLRLFAAGGKVYFNAGDPDHGDELWESDGTEQGTRLVQDIAPGAASSQPFQLAQAGDRLFFSANDGISGREPWVLPLAGPAGCVPSDRALCLAGGRFRAEIQWRDFQGSSGHGHAASLTPDTGYFWFFDAANVEVIVKALDGQGLNGHHWVFYGALSSVEYTLTITDTQTGAARRYANPPGRLGSVGDTEAFGPRGATGASLSLGPAAEEWKPTILRSRTAALAPCVPSSNRLCLNQGRFAVEAAWRDFQGKTGTAAAVPLTGDTGYFWFFDEKNVEVVLKVLDGQALNGKFWVFYGALSSVEYTLTVTDTQTGQTRTYRNPSGRLASVADTGAF